MGKLLFVIVFVVGAMGAVVYLAGSSVSLTEWRTATQMGGSIVLDHGASGPRMGTSR